MIERLRDSYFVVGILLLVTLVIAAVLIGPAAIERWF